MGILLSQFYTFQHKYADLMLWVAFGTDNHFSLYSIKDWCQGNRCYSLPVFHAFTASSFLNKGKLSAWNTLKIFLKILKAFAYIRDNLFCDIEMDSDIFKLFQRYVMLLYDRVSNLQSVNLARRQLFCKNGRSLENLPPTENASSFMLKLYFRPA